MNTQHNWTVIGVQVKEDWCSNKVLGKVPEERNRSKGHKSKNIQNPGVNIRVLINIRIIIVKIRISTE